MKIQGEKVGVCAVRHVCGSVNHSRRHALLRSHTTFMKRLRLPLCTKVRGGGLHFHCCSMTLWPVHRVQTCCSGSLKERETLQEPTSHFEIDYAAIILRCYQAATYLWDASMNCGSTVVWERHSVAFIFPIKHLLPINAREQRKWGQSCNSGSSLVSRNNSCFL